MTSDDSVPDFEHGLTPDEFTLLLNLMVIVCKRGGFNISEYEDILPLYKKMQDIAKNHPDLFSFESSSEETDEHSQSDTESAGEGKSESVLSEADKSPRKAAPSQGDVPADGEEEKVRRKRVSGAGN